MKLEQLQIKRNYNHLMLPLTITLSLIVIRVIELILLVLQLRPIKNHNLYTNSHMTIQKEDVSNLQ